MKWIYIIGSLFLIAGFFNITFKSNGEVKRQVLIEKLLLCVGLAILLLY